MTYNGYVADLFFNACAIVMWAAFLWRVLDGPRFSWWGTALLTLVIDAAYLLPVLLLEPELLPVLELLLEPVLLRLQILLLRLPDMLYHLR